MSTACLSSQKSFLENGQTLTLLLIKSFKCTLSSDKEMIFLNTKFLKDQNWNLNTNSKWTHQLTPLTNNSESNLIKNINNSKDTNKKKSIITITSKWVKPWILTEITIEKVPSTKDTCLFPKVLLSKAFMSTLKWSTGQIFKKRIFQDLYQKIEKDFFNLWIQDQLIKSNFSFLQLTSSTLMIHQFHLIEWPK